MVILKATEKSASVLNWNEEVVRVLFRVSNTWASFPGHSRGGISCDRKFLEDICQRWNTLVLEVQHVNLLDSYAKTLRAPPAVFFALSFPSSGLVKTKRWHWKAYSPRLLFSSSEAVSSDTTPQIKETSMICIKRKVQLSLKIVCKQFASDSLVLMIVLSFLLTVLPQQFHKQKWRLIIKYNVVTGLRIPCEHKDSSFG